MIHATADVAEGATIGRETNVWHRAQIREGAVIGAECVIGKDVYIDAGVVIGDRVKIENAALVYHGVTVESGVFIGPGAILTNDRMPRAIRADGAAKTGSDWTVGEIHLGYGCSIGAGAVVVAGCDIGAWAMVGAGSVVTRSVRDHALVVGDPARPIGWVCRCGQRLTVDDADGSARCPVDATRFTVADGQCTEISAS
ncbi:MAG: acyltransferase [Candidatus Limnocylindrales bacterium]